MSIINTSYVEITTFFLVGMPGLEYAHSWISILICSVYLIAVLGNCTILFIIRTEPSLHEPMYYFLCMLAMSDLGLSLSSLPTMLRIFLFNAPEISFNACFAQEFFIHGFSALESSVLLIMSFDRFLAIHNPLSYSSILTTVRVVQIGIVFSFKSMLLVLPFPFTLRNLSYYFILIAVSYILILKTVLGIVSKKEQLKALSTCVSHICAVIIFYLPVINLAIVHRFAQHVSPLINVLMANVLLLVPPLMNPIVYCAKTKQIRDFGGHPPSPMSPHTMTLESLGNSSSSISSTFLLSGISGLERMHIWISIPLCFMYLVSIMGNCTILFIIKTERSLHEPMYLFLSMLALIDLGLSLCTLPTVLGIFWVGAREISHDSCFAQLFFIHSLSFLESSVLLSMAFDRFVAICRPLHYASILTNTVIGRIGLVSLGRSVALIFPLPFMLKRFPYCGSPVLSHSYCLHQDVMKLACADIKANSIYGMFVIVSTVGIDSLLILFSYTLILRTVLSIASRAERLKAFNTCVSHICAVLLFYTPMIGLSIIHRFGKQVPHLVQVVMGFMYLLFPPVINPIVYSVKTKQIQDRVTHAFCNCV
uniref:Olfactory receptor, family 51, subfamily G, member 2 (Predicted) n=1 Tax=Plecturocebus moloch TaxID=9523 RepID=B1MT94_PLEMO|nr:olfactory receptor, family 51, subfamily G, member 2 (predicted) [Plecturocebus moloch]